MQKIEITGKLFGRKLSSDEKDFISADLVHIQNEFRPEGPAENSIIEIRYLAKQVIAGYIPWVGYFDLDREIKANHVQWEIVEPAAEYTKKDVFWKPFAD